MTQSLTGVRTSADPARAGTSGHSDLLSICLDNLEYNHDDEIAWCLVSPSTTEAFPRNLICTSGVLFPVRELRSLDLPNSSYQIPVSCRVCIPSSVEHLCRECFARYAHHLVVTFESGSKLSWIEDYAFSNPSLRPSICIPSSVEKLGKHCFNQCCLSSVTFEFNGVLRFHQFPFLPRWKRFAKRASLDVGRFRSSGSNLTGTSVLLRQGYSQIVVVTGKCGLTVIPIEHLTFLLPAKMNFR
jgi:hypothetical protein